MRSILYSLELKYVGFYTTCGLQLLGKTPLHADQVGGDEYNLQVLPCQGQWVSNNTDGEHLELYLGTYSQVSCSKHIEPVTLMVAVGANPLNSMVPLQGTTIVDDANQGKCTILSHSPYHIFFTETCTVICKIGVLACGGLTISHKSPL